MARASRHARLARAAAAQFGGVCVALVLVVPALKFGLLAPSGLAFAIVAGIGAALIGFLLGLDAWWRPTHLAVPVLAWFGFASGIDPVWFLAAFGVTFLCLGLTPGTAVPLYLSGRGEVDALAGLLPEGARLRLLDAGCGLGTVLARLAERSAATRLEGVESALVPWLIACLRAALTGRRFSVAWGSLWRADFGRYDVVYAFLSPEPMPRLWRKAQREMRPGTLLVSNSFAVPGVAPERSIVTAGGRRLYLWRM
jgi:hypothetical protein